MSEGNFLLCSALDIDPHTRVVDSSLSASLLESCDTALKYPQYGISDEKIPFDMAVL